MLRSLKKRLSRGEENERNQGTIESSPKTPATNQEQYADPQRSSSSTSTSIPHVPNSTAISTRAGSSGSKNSAGRMVAAAINKAKLSAKDTLLKSPRIVIVGEPYPMTAASNPLVKFDACVEAADALAASSGHESGIILPSQRIDETTGLSDCSVLVSPDGDLLLSPGDPRKLFNENSGDGEAVEDEGFDEAGKELSASLFSELMLHAKDEYMSSVFLGSDLYDDKMLNRFSSKGWSITATSDTVSKTSYVLQHTASFCEELILIKKETAARTSDAVDGFQMHLERTRQLSFPMQYGSIVDPQRFENSLEPYASDPHHQHHHVVTPKMVASVPSRVGPMAMDGCSLSAALYALGNYYSHSAQDESARWRKATLLTTGFTSSSSGGDLSSIPPPPLQSSSSRASSGCMVSSLRMATETLNERAQKRQLALEEAASRVQQMEQRMHGLKQLAASKWDAVYLAEDMVTQRVEAAMQERSREREKLRMEQLRIADVEGGTGLGATTEEIWSIVSTVAESMEDGSFEPIDMPEVSLSVPRDRSRSADDTDAAIASATDEMSPSNVDSDNISPKSVVSREAIERELYLPELRAAAMAADEAVADGADALMNLLTTLDTTRRSAKVAADTCLVSACNTQAAFIRSLLKIERESLEERLKQLEEAEKLAEQIDVRADLDRYIAADKSCRGGSSHLGDDDDGGIASALAILSRHVDGSMGSDPLHRMSVEVSSAEDDGITTEMLTDAVDSIFQQEDPSVTSSDAPQSSAGTFSRRKLADAVDFLCTTVSKVGPSARARRSNICYLLNAKRSTRAEIATLVQFRALCRLFSAILAGCNAEEGGVSNAKMCIMLAQTFYVVKVEPTEDDDGLDMSENPEEVEKVDVTREHRVYVKSFLKSHPIWSSDDFWDNALSNQITESLTHSGVMANFEKGPVTNNSKERKRSEWTEARKIKWYDLNSLERTEAASQVQAVVFAQLGALAHSMIELGCGLERSCAFVRRMAIRHQLPNSQRTMLLQHLIKRENVEKQEAFIDEGHASF